MSFRFEKSYFLLFINQTNLNSVCTGILLRGLILLCQGKTPPLLEINRENTMMCLFWDIATYLISETEWREKGCCLRLERVTCNCLATVVFIILWIDLGMYLKIINQNCFFGNLSLELHIYCDKDSSANYVAEHCKNLTIRFWNDFSMFTLVQPKATTSNVCSER